MDQGRLPYSAASREVAREHGGERDEGQTEGEYAQAHDGPCVAYPQKTDGFRKKIQYRAGRGAEGETVGGAAAHRSADAVAAPETYLLRHEPRDGKAYAAHGEGRRQQLDAHHQLVEPYPRSAYPPRQPGLKGHAYAAHQQ